MFEVMHEVGLRVWTYKRPWLRIWVSELDEDGSPDPGTMWTYAVGPGAGE